MSFSLTYHPALSRPDLLAPRVADALRTLPWADQVRVAEIDPTLSDTARFCEAYSISLEESVNCVVIVAKRGADVTYAACMIAATMRANVNGLVRQHLGARKASFGPVDMASSTRAFCTAWNRRPARSHARPIRADRDPKEW